MWHICFPVFFINVMTYNINISYWYKGGPKSDQLETYIQEISLDQIKSWDCDLF